MNMMPQEFEVRAEEEELKLLYKALPMSQTVAFINAAVLIFFSWGEINHANVMGWGVAFLGVTLLRLLDCYRFLQQKDNARTANIRFILGSSFAGLVWGSSAWLLFPEDSITHQLLVIFITAGVTAGGLTTLAVSKKAYIIFLSLTLAPLALRLFLQDSHANLAMGGLILLYTGALISAGKLLHNNIRENLSLRLKAEVREKQLADNEAKLIQAHQQAEAANEAKSAFLANMSHELRTPMNGIIGMTYLALQSGLEDKQKEMVATAHSSAKNLLTIINDILDLSKIEARKLTLELIPFRIRDVLNQVIQHNKIEARKKNINLLLQLELPDRSELLGDPVRLGQVLTNMLSNAIKFSKEGQQVVIQINGIKSAKHHSVTFTVKDEGIGISEEQLAELFQPFSQADASTTRKYGGTGLGLNIAQRLVVLMGGEIHVTSQLGKGSAFSFSLEFAEAEQNENTAFAKHASPSSYLELKGKRVLLVEDNAINQQVALGILHKQGLEVEIANNGQEAVDLLQEKTFDAVLMDCEMPVLDGYAATEQIRAAEQGKRTPIIAMTAHAIKGAEEKARAVGMDDYITKPVDPEDVWSRLLKWISA